MKFPAIILLMFLVLALVSPGNVPAQTLELSIVDTGFTRPIYVTHAGDGSGRLFVVGQGGTIQIIDGGSTLPTPFLDINAKVVTPSGCCSEQGLLGLAFHPDYSSNGRFFVSYTATSTGDTVIAEYTVSANPDIANTAETIILTTSQPQGNHNGGHITFGPSDGYLYIGIGDGGGAGDDDGGHTGGLGNGQDPSNLLGNILRIDIDTGSPYAIPATNPFVGSSELDEIYAWGLRNPWRFSFDQGGTNQLFCGDVGQGSWEEIDIIASGGNYGWRRMEGTNCFNPGSGCQTGSLLLPIHEYSHGGGRCSVTGGYVYRGNTYPNFAGLYFYGDYCTGDIWTLEEDSPGSGTYSSTLMMSSALALTNSLSSFGEGENGELYLCDYSFANSGQGKVFQLIDTSLASVKGWRAY